MRFGEQVSGQRSEAAKTVRYEHAILLSASFDYCAQFSAYVKAASSPELHKYAVAVLGELLGSGDLAGGMDFVRVSHNKNTGVLDWWCCE
jgi:hypothetical protein